MTEPLLLNVSLAQPALHVDVTPGGEIVLRGSFSSKFDGSVVDAATTTWPAGAPGGATIDAGGLIDFEAGGFHVTSRDPVRHEVHAVATGDVGAACSALQVQSPCLPVRLQPMALSRLMTVADWNASLIGPREGLALEVVAPPIYAPRPADAPYAILGGAVIALWIAAASFAVYLSRKKQFAASPAGRLLALAARVRGKLDRADAVVAAPLAPALAAAFRALQAKRIDATSAEGRRVQAALEKVELRIDASEKQTRAEKEQEAADELVREFESALEAADEATLAAAPLDQRT